MTYPALGSMSLNLAKNSRESGPLTSYTKGIEMPKFLIERNIPDVGKLTPEQLTAASQTSCSVLRNIGPEIQWVQSYVTANKLFCVYIAPSEELIRRHATESGFPAHTITPIQTIIDPTTPEA